MNRPPPATADARATFPSRVAPELVLEFLDLPSLAAALRASANFSEAAEPVFHGIARRHGRTDKLESSTWRDTVRLVECNPLTWIGAIKSQATRAGRIAREYETVDGFGLSHVTLARLENSVYIVARGLRLDEVTEWTWRVKMSTHSDVVQACGLAFYSQNQVELAVLWNEDGLSHDEEKDWVIEPETASDEDDETEPLTFDEDATCTLEVHFRKSLGIYTVELRVIAEGGARGKVSRFTGEIPSDWQGSNFHIAPLVNIYGDSTATLERSASDT